MKKKATKKVVLSAEKKRELSRELLNSRMSQEAYEMVLDIGIVKFVNKIQDMSAFESELVNQYVSWLKKAPGWVKREWYDDFGKPGSIGKYEDFWFRSYGRLITVSDIDRYLDDENYIWYVEAEKPFAIVMGTVLNKQMGFKERQTKLFENACIGYIREAEKNMKFCLAKVGIN